MEWLICKRVHPSRKIVSAFNLGLLKYKDVPILQNGVLLRYQVCSVLGLCLLT